MVTWSRIDKDGKERLIRSFETFDQAVIYFRSLKDPFSVEPEKECSNCVFWDGTYCTKELNNMDYSLATDDMYREPGDTCEDWSEIE